MDFRRIELVHYKKWELIEMDFSRIESVIYKKKKVRINENGF